METGKKNFKKEKSELPINKKETKTNYYDTIEKKDLEIKEKKNHLNRIKSASIKECLYSNHNIPKQWKIKIGYQNKILQLFSRDKNFLSYCGKGPLINNNEKNDNEIKSYMNKTGNFFYRKKIDNKNIEKEEKKNVKENDKINKYKYFSKSQKDFSNKEVSNILENFRSVYPLKEKINSIIEKEEENELLDENKIRIYTQNLLNKKDNLFENLYKLKYNQRIDSFKHSIYTQIITPNLRAKSSKNKNKKIFKFEDSKFGPFLNSNSELFYKQIEINNPIKRRYLERINNFGPYYSYCPPCKYKNLDFYNQMNEAQTIKLIKHIQNQRYNNEIFNNKKVNTLKKNYKSTLNTNNTNNYNSNVIDSKININD